MITVPAYFDNKQKKATEKAGRIAGLKVLRLITEPAASALAYGLHRNKGEKNVFVFDLGGGTYDISVLKVKDNKYSVVSTNGDTQLGGIDFDEKLLQFCVHDFLEKTGEDIHQDVKAMHKLRVDCEKAKIHLSSRIEVFTDSLSFVP